MTWVSLKNVGNISILILLLNADISSGIQDCFYCSGRASPLCEGDHPGKVQSCPPPDHVYTVGTNKTADNYPDKFVCFIMKTVVKSTNAIEISKGCLLNDDYLAKEIDGSDAYYLEPGQCYTHSDESIYDRFVDFHDVTICICDTDACNKERLKYTDPNNITIEIGREDIEARKTRKKGGVSTYEGSLWVNIIAMCIMYLVS